MKYLFKLSFIISVLAIIFSACQKVGVLPSYANGIAPVLTSSATGITPTPTDSNKVVATFSWTNPQYATDSTTQKFILEIDSSGRNFTKQIKRIVTGVTGISFTGSQINNILADFGFTPGQTFSFDIRVTSSYSNNNDQLKSNIIKVNIKSYLVPILLTPSSSSNVVLQVANATSPAISFNWNASTYGSNIINYALQFDVVGGNFSTPKVIKYGTSLISSITVSDLNAAAIAAGIIGGSTQNLEYRIVSYLGTNYTTLLVISNVVTISTTTYVPIPENLYIIGDASPLGWNNDAGLSPSQQFTRIDAVSYGIVVNLTAGKAYLFLPVAGDWSHKFGGSANGVTTPATLLADNAVPGTNTPAPSTSGLYSIVVNFQTGTYSVTPYTQVIPANLYIIGGATPIGWDNSPGLSPKQQFKKLDAVSFGIIVNLKAGESYLFLPVAGDWSHKFGGNNATSGNLLADGAVPGSNTPSPSVAGTYQIVVNFLNNSYTVTPYVGTAVPPNLYIVGDATAGGWSNPVPTPTQQFIQTDNATFELTLPLAGSGSYLLLPLNGSYDHKFGGTSDTGGNLLADGAVPGSNTPAPSSQGNFKIVVDFYKNTYSVTPQ